MSKWSSPSLPWFPLATGDLARPGGALDAVAGAHSVAPAQAAIALLLQRSPVTVPIPATNHIAYFEENLGSAELGLSRPRSTGSKRSGAGTGSGRAATTKTSPPPADQSGMDDVSLASATDGEPRFRLALCTIFRNEAEDLHEWLEFHRHVGIEHAFLYNNLSTDEPLAVLAPYIEEGFATVIEWPLEPGQLAAFEHCDRTFGKQADWIAHIDADEYLFAPSGESVPAVLERFRGRGGVAVNMIAYGDSGHLRRPDRSTVVAYSRRGGSEHLFSRHVKTIVDPRRVAAWNSPHIPRLLGDEPLIDERGGAVHRPVTNSVSVEVLRINHYLHRSDEDKLRKVVRRRADTDQVTRSWDAICLDGGLNEVEDLCILDVWTPPTCKRLTHTQPLDATVVVLPGDRDAQAISEASVDTRGLDVELLQGTLAETIPVARGDFLAVLRPGDTWPPGRLAAHVAAFRARRELVLVWGEERPAKASLSRRSVRDGALGALMMNDWIPLEAATVRRGLLPLGLPVPSWVRHIGWWFTALLAEVGAVAPVPLVAVERATPAEPPSDPLGELRLRRFLLNRVRPDRLSAPELDAALRSFELRVLDVAEELGVQPATLVAVGDEDRERAESVLGSVIARARTAMSANDVAGMLWQLTKARALDPFSESLAAAVDELPRLPNGASLGRPPSGPDNLRSRITVAALDQLEARPELLKTYFAEVNEEDDATLLVAGNFAESRIVAAIVSAGSSPDSCPDVRLWSVSVAHAAQWARWNAAMCLGERLAA